MTSGIHSPAEVSPLEPSVVVGYDQTPPSTRTLDEAAAEAVRRGAVLTIVHAFPRTTSVKHPHAGPGVQYAARTTALRIGEQGAEYARSRHPGLEVRVRAHAGSTASVLVGSSSDADLLTVGCWSHDGRAELALGSVTAEVAAWPACPTMFVRGGRHMEPPGSIGSAVLAAVDLEDPAEEVLAFAFAEARLRRTGLEAINVQEAFQPGTNADLALEKLLKPWCAEYFDVPVRHELAAGHPPAVLTAATASAGLIVAGVHRHPGDGLRNDDGHIGAVLEALLLRAACPIVIVPR